MAESLTSIEPRTTPGTVAAAVQATEPTATPQAGAESLTATPEPGAVAETPAAAPTQTALDKAQAAAAKALKGAELNKQRRADAAARQAVEAENQRLRNEASERQKREELYKTDKRAVLRDYEIDAKTLAQRQLEEQTPEGLRRQLEEKFERQIAAERAERERLEKTIASREAQAKYAVAEKIFRQEASDATRYPHVAQQPYQVILTTAKSLIEDGFRRTGEQYSNAEVFSYLEGLYAKQSAGKTPGTAPIEKPETPTSPRTISAKLASDRFSLPPNFDDLSDREQRRHLAKAYAESGKK